MQLKTEHYNQKVCEISRKLKIKNETNEKMTGWILQKICYNGIRMWQSELKWNFLNIKNS